MTGFRLNNSVPGKLLMTNWISTLLVKVLHSVYGRALQYWISDTVGYRITAWLIGLTMLTLAASLLATLRLRRLLIPYFICCGF